ncbi:hypothetical protein KX816_06890 [Sphingosinicellaceae bacterium]|nr:hypothetical protein KX816_06890 [Sphingosinicellaceae bacterium]
MAAGAANGAATADARFAAAHKTLLADPRIQFDLPTHPPEPPPPEWLKRVLDWIIEGFKKLAEAGPVVKILFWLIVAAIVLALLRWLWPYALRLWHQLRKTSTTDEEGWRPEAAPARALLAEADALAADGAYAEAAHLVLLRSVEQIGARRPHMVRPALTSRDIAQVEGLPGDVARAFGLIASVVETGLFAARPVGADAWARCREAYEAVAFPRAWAA